MFVASNKQLEQLEDTIRATTKYRAASAIYKVLAVAILEGWDAAQLSQAMRGVGDTLMDEGNALR